MAAGNSKPSHHKRRPHHPPDAAITDQSASRPHGSAIEDYAIIGDCTTAALVSKNGSIDWLCWPRFDSPACFAALLGTAANGYWRIAPEGEIISVNRRYRSGTLILETVFETSTGSVALIDFMPAEKNAIVRIVEGRSGTVEMAFQLALRFEYGSVVPWVTRLNHGSGIRAIAGPDQIVLHSDVTLHGRAMTTVASFTTSAGSRHRFAMAYSSSHLPSPIPPDPDQALSDTEAAWTAWSGRCSYGGRYREEVQRSLLTLKALSYYPTGGIVAAATTSLPERLGGERNWDYRFCWLRDATFTLMALVHAGYREEAQAWGAWLRRSVAGAPSQLQILYGLAGERWMQEWTVPWLSGYQDAKPVRIGNGAHDQLQLDVYGELMDALYQEITQGLLKPHRAWEQARTLIEHLEEIWQEPDESIWEVRGGRQHFTFSRVMVWVAFDRAIRLAECYGLSAPLERWRTERDKVHQTVCEAGFNSKRNSFVQVLGGEALDASLLLMPLVGFLPPEDPRIVGTVEAIGQNLMSHGLIRRYRVQETQDGLTGDEGLFLACSFWYVDNLVLQKREAEARAMFEHLLSLCNDVGLLAEEYDPVARRQLGNFPQAFSHLALISSALNLDTLAGPAERRSQGGD